MQQSGIGQAGSVVLKGLKSTRNRLKSRQQASKKAMTTAARVEAFRMKNKLQRQLRQGSPGGRTLHPLSYIARRLSRKSGSPNRKPLSKLAFAVRYAVDYSKDFSVKVGFVQPNYGKHTLSDSWRRIIKNLQEGFDRPISEKQRRFIVSRGEELGHIEGGTTPFFLRKTTQRFKTPRRKIVQPFWRGEQREALRNIRSNYRRKMRGERI